MDLNERIAARRKEIAAEEERVRREAAQQRQIALQAERQIALQAERRAALALKAAQPPVPDPFTHRVQATKVVDIDLQARHFREAVERMTKGELALFIGLVLLSIYGLTKHLGISVFFAACTLVYLWRTLRAHLKAIQNPVDPVTPAPSAKPASTMTPK